MSLPSRGSGVVLVALVASGVGCGSSDGNAVGHAASGPAELPVRYAADRFFVTPVLERGDTLELYTDTGGGLNMLWQPTADRLDLTGTWVHLEGDSLEVAELPAMQESAAIPLPAADPPLDARFAIMPARSEIEGDGFLGRTWFRDRVWLFDYPGRSLSLVRDTGFTLAPAHRVPLGFQTDSVGRRTTHFPRIQAVVDGDTLDFLFDTGATTVLSDQALAVVGDGRPARRGGSFIVASVFERWRERHPDWRIIEGGGRSTGASLIEVPEITVAGHTVGPVWFTTRADRNFHEWMSQWMDRRVDGALGGSAFRYFRILVNYPEAYAEFARVEAGAGR